MSAESVQRVEQVRRDVLSDPSALPLQAVEAAERRGLHALVQTLLNNADLSDETLFSALALRIHRWQQQSLPAVRVLARRPGTAERTHQSWQTLPGIPISALLGGESAGLHTLEPSLLDLEARPVRSSCAGVWLDDAALVLHLKQRLFPDRQGCRLIGLARVPEHPEPRTLPWVLRVLEQTFDTGPAEWLAEPAGVPPMRLLRALELAALGGEPTLLIGSRTGVRQALSTLELARQTLPLPLGSRLLLIEPALTGLQALHDPSFLDAIGSRLGVPESHVVGMLQRFCSPGMLFTDALSAWAEERAPAKGWCLPPWMRACALEPETLMPLPSGHSGMILSVNVARVDRPLALLEEQPGLVGEDGSLYFLAHGLEDAADERLWTDPPARWSYELSIPEEATPPRRLEHASR